MLARSVDLDTRLGLPDEGSPPLKETTREERIPGWADAVLQAANERLLRIEEAFAADAVTIISPIVSPLEHQVREVVESRRERRKSLLVILDTVGGVVEVAERIARVFRQYYREVKFLVPDRALSAGTVLVMSGDAILMDYHSVLGPIDPQVVKDGKLVPALGYLIKFRELVEKADKGELSTPDVILLDKLDLAEMHQYELARDLSTQLLRDWLAKYKFKDWKVTETKKKKVTKQMKEVRAQEIAEKLSDTQRWGSHGRGIPMEVLVRELRLKVDDFGTDPAAQRNVWNYLWFLRDYMQNARQIMLVHAPYFS